MRRERGFTLIEMIVTMVIMGIILTVGSMFFASMMTGLANTQRAAELGPAAQIALDRMAFEIRNATGQGGGETVAYVANTSLTFESTSTSPDLTGTTRAIRYDSGGSALYLDVDLGNYLLLDNVTTFTLGVTENDIDGNSGNGNEISSVDISLQVSGYGGTFTLQVAPRTFIRR